jgi:hypothetical protein
VPSFLILAAHTLENFSIPICLIVNIVYNKKTFHNDYVYKKGIIFYPSLFLVSLLAVLFLGGTINSVDAVLVGDINSDRRVDIIDIGIVIDSYGRRPPLNPRADLNGDGVSDIVDIGIIIDNYGRSETATSPPTAPPNPPGNSLTDCSGYTPRRVFLETQAWWMDTNSITGPVPPGQKPVNGIGGHAHTATCFPQDQEIPNGNYHFDVRLMLHKGQVGEIDWLDIGLGPDGQSLSHKVFNPRLKCPGGESLAVMCEMWIPIDLTVDNRIPPGYGELRFRFHLRQPNGEEQFASTSWMGYYHGSHNVYNRRPPMLMARGWYTGANYESAQLISPFPYEPVSGNWTFKVAMVPGSGGIPVATHSVHVDARFNMDDFGLIVNQGRGEFSGDVTLDTTRLNNGNHCVAVRVDSVDKNGGTDTGILQFPIKVNNPGRPAGNGKGGCAPGT